MKPQCLCGQAIQFGRRNVMRCVKCHALQVRDYDGLWIFEASEFAEDNGSSTLFIPKERGRGYVRTHSQAAFEAAQYQKARCGL